jgi:hypothetical protein
MSIIQFPNNPTTNQTFTVGYKTWIWNGYAWDLQLANTTPITSLAQAAYNQANTASSNTIYTQGVDTSQNTRLGAVEANTIYLFGALNATNTNYATAVSSANNQLKSYTDGAITSANNQLKSYTDGAITSANNQLKSYTDSQIGGVLSYTSGVDSSQNNRLSTVEANTIYLFGALNQTNTNITSANTQLKAYVDGLNSYQQSVNNVQNTSIGTINSTLLYLQGIENYQNTYTQAAFDTANTAYNFVAHGGTVAGNVSINGNLQVTGNITYTGNVISQTLTGNSAQFFGNNTTGFGALYAGVPTGYVIEPQTVVQLSSNYNGYSQLNFQNENNGGNASTDLVCTADNGTANDTFIDMGINSSLYNQAGYGLAGANDGYLYVYGNTSTGGGNLIISTMTQKDIIFSVNGQDPINEVFRVSGTTNNVKINSGVQSTSNSTGALVVNGGVGVTGNVNATGSLSVYNGMYSTGTYNGPYSDGVVVDYVTGTGRISVGSNDGIFFYNNVEGGRTKLLSLQANGEMVLTQALQTASQGIIFNDGTTQTTAAAPYSYSSSGFSVANTASSNTVYLQGALNQTNTNIVNANTQLKSYTDGQISSVYTYFNGVETSQNTSITVATNLAQGAYNQANTDYTTVAPTAGSYGNSTSVPVIAVSANGRITSVSTSTITAGATITDDTSSNATRYIMLGTSTSGSYTVANTSSSKLSFNPSTGILSATSFSGAGTGLTGTASSLSIGGSAPAGSLTGTTLASGVTGSSLTSVGTITSGTWSGSFGAVSGASLTSLTAGNLTGTIPSAVLGNSTLYIGTTPVALNRSSASQSLTGVNIDGSSGSVVTTTATGVQSSYTAALNTTTPGTGTYGLHFNGMGTADYASGITWASTFGTTSAQAGIYVQSSPSYGTKMYIATTDAYVSGSKTAVSIDHTGLVNFVRQRPTYAGNVILDAGNYSTYASPLAGSSSLTTTGTITSGTWSGSFGAVSGANLTNLTAGNLSGTIPSGVLGNSTHYIGTTAIALNRASGSQALTGITSIDGTASNITAYTINQNVGTSNTPTFAGIITSSSLKRNAAGTGYLDGQYNTYETSATTGPIYTIGGTYYPTSSSLNTMYGVGYTYSNTATGSPGGVPAGRWGFYGASNGTARFFLDTDNGHAYFSGSSYINGTMYDGASTGYYVKPSGTSNLNLINSNGVYTASGWLTFADTDRNAGSSTYYPNSATRAVRFSFSNAGYTGTGGNYSGVLHFHPWDGTTSSTGDASYQLAFGSTAANGSGYPQLRIRNGIDTTWNSWYDILTSYNYSSYALPLTGGTVSGSLYLGGTLYDNSNTAYYVKPSSTTNLYALTVNQTISGSISGTAASETLATVTGRGATTAGSITVPAADNNGYYFWGSTSAYGIKMGNTAEYHYGPVTDYSIRTTIDSNSSTRGFTWGVNGTTPIAALNVGNGNMQIAGTFSALSKSFVIDHPTKEGKKLRYGSLEGPENGVYVRGRLSDSEIIELPDYWPGLVHEDSITVNLTSIGKHQNLYVKDIKDNTVIVGGSKNINCFFTVFAERKDVDKLIVEYDA